MFNYLKWILETENANLQYHMGSEWDESKFKPQDPRNLLVDPDVVVTAYKKLRS